MSDNITDLEARRWREKDEPKDHAPISALNAARRAIEAGEIEPKHIIVIVASDGENGGCRTRYYQAGEYEYHAQLGLVSRVAHLMGD